MKSFDAEPPFRTRHCWPYQQLDDRLWSWPKKLVTALLELAEVVMRLQSISRAFAVLTING